MQVKPTEGQAKTTEKAVKNLPDFNAAIDAELADVGEFGRITLTLDWCAGKLVRFTLAREKSVKVGVSHA